MRKISLIIFIGVTSMVIMACSFFGIAQQNPESLAPVDVAEQEFPTAIEQSPSEEVNNTYQLKDTPEPIKPAPTIDPIASAKSCLANTWEINGLSDYVIAAIPPDMAEEYDLEYKDTSGEAYFTLTPDGQIILQADDFELLFTAKVSVFAVPVTVRVDGTANGNYDINSSTLTTSNIDTSKLNASAQALGEDLMDPEQITKTIPFLSPPYNTANYSCQGDLLILELSGYSGSIPPLVFRAVE
jgi:hypothetical protein